MWLVLAACSPSPVASSAGDVDPPLAAELSRQRTAAHEYVVRRIGDGPRTELLVDGVVALDAGWSPDRVVVSPEGAVAFVSGRTGLASVWVLLPRGTEPVQLTNVGLEGVKRSPGHPPPGFVAAPPGPMRFEGDTLTWTGPDGPLAVAWR